MVKREEAAERIERGSGINRRDHGDSPLSIRSRVCKIVFPKILRILRGKSRRYPPIPDDSPTRVENERLLNYNTPLDTIGGP